MDILVAAVFAGAPLAWVLYRFASVPRTTFIHSKKAQQLDPVIKLYGSGTYDFGVVGTSRHRSVLRKIYGDGFSDGKHVDAILVLEKTGNAVRVEIDGYAVGHLLPDVASEYRRRLAEGGFLNVRGACRARISARHGTVNHVDYAVRLDLPSRR